VDELLERLLSELVSNVKRGEQRGQQRILTERELADVLGVSRNSLRERLSALEVLGLIRRTQGSGTYLDMPHSVFVRLHFEMAMRLGYIEIEQLEQAREMLERASVRQAALLADQQDIDHLDRCVQEMLETESVQADYEFHFRLIKAAKNPVIELIAEGLSPLLQELLQSRHQILRRDPAAFACANNSHVGIVEAIRAHDPSAAERALDEHFRTWRIPVSAGEAASPRPERGSSTSAVDDSTESGRP
jgi:GntR family transcriptional repressor for pyruvate dehydrogenase complex